MVSVTEFLKGVASIVQEKPTYELGKDGRGKRCDCIGLIIGAIRRAGGTWNGLHGSNWTARNRVIRLFTPAEISLGAMVFKAYEPGDPKWDLPPRYAKHPDQRDYYHVGVVTSVSPLRITHCTGGSTNGIKVDTSIGKWRFSAKDKYIDYDQKEEPPVPELQIRCRVVAPSGKTVRVRERTATNAKIKTNLDIGTEVLVTKRDSDWSYILYPGGEGWMQSKFLVSIPDDESTHEITLRLPRTTAMELRDALNNVLL